MTYPLYQFCGQATTTKEQVLQLLHLLMELSVSIQQKVCEYFSSFFFLLSAMTRNGQLCHWRISSPLVAPTEHKAMGSSTNAPHKFFNSPPKERLYPPLSAPSTSFQRDHHLKDNMTAITPSSYEVHPHLSTEQGSVSYLRNMSVDILILIYATDKNSVNN